VTHASKPVWNGNSLAHRTTYWILCSGTFQRLGVSQKHGRRQFDFSDKHYGILYLHLEFVGRHQTELVPAPHEFNFHVNFIQYITTLKKPVGVYATHHVHDVTSGSKAGTLVQATVPCSLGEIDVLHAIGLIRIEENRCQLRCFGIVTVAEKRLDHSPIGIGIRGRSHLRSVQ